MCDKTGMSKATIWRLVAGDPTFPKPFKLSPGVTVWDEDEADNWLAFKKNEQRAHAA